MKIPLSGPSYTSRSVVAAAQQCMNLYPEVVEVPDEPRRRVLYGRPGLKLFTTMSPAKIRCLWAGGGRLFVVNGTNLTEVHQDGTQTVRTGTVGQLGSTPDPAQIFSNGHQLLIVSGNQAYCDNGAGPVLCRFQIGGTANTSGTTATWVSGDVFTPSMSGRPVVIDGSTYIATYVDSGHINLDHAAPTATGVAWNADGGDPVDAVTGGFLDGYGIVNRVPNPPGPGTSGAGAMSGTVNTAGTGSVIWNSGDQFIPSEAGGHIVIAGSTYNVINFFSPMQLLVDPVVPAGTALPYSITLTRLVSRSGAPATPDPGRQFNISALNDFTFWDPLDFGVKEGHSDYIRSVLCDHEELWLLGTETIEVWSNIGSTLDSGGVATFPFQRIPGAFVHDGSVATYAPCSVGAYTCWLGGTPSGQTVAYRALAFQPERISTHAQEQTWNAPDFRVDDCVSYAYRDGGHLFWVLNFWQQQATWVYDMTSGMWHERAGWDFTNKLFLRYKAWYHVFIPEWGTGGKHIVGDPATGNLYEASLDFYDDDGQAIEYLRAFPHLLNEDQNNYPHRFELYMETGTPAATFPAMLVGLDWSDDRGHTFINRNFASGGVNGDYTRRVVWRRLGKSRDRVYRVGIEGSAKVALTDAFLEVTPGFA